jgi:ribosomal protein L24E
MKKTEKVTQLRHLRDGKIFKVFAKNQTYVSIGTLYIKDNGQEIVVPRNKCTHASNIDKKTKRIKPCEFVEEDIVCGVNDFGYPNYYWD